MFSLFCSVIIQSDDLYHNLAFRILQLQNSAHSLFSFQRSTSLRFNSRRQQLLYHIMSGLEMQAFFKSFIQLLIEAYLPCSLFETAYFLAGIRIYHVYKTYATLFSK